MLLVHTIQKVMSEIIQHSYLEEKFGKIINEECLFFAFVFPLVNSFHIVRNFS